jgi:hypothetical protein
LKYSGSKTNKRKPGAVRDAITETLAYRTRGATVAEIVEGVRYRIGPTPASSIRSYLRLNTPKLFTKIDRGRYAVREEAQAMLGFVEQNGDRTSTSPISHAAFRFGSATLIHGDCFDWLANAPTKSIEAVVTDPPYGLVEYSEEEQEKLRKGRGGVWLASRHRLTGTNAHRCPVSLFFHAMTSGSWNDSSSLGRACCFQFLLQARTF